MTQISSVLSPVSTRLQRGLAVIVVLLALYVAVTSMIGAVLNYSPAPFWDMWDGYLNFYTQVTDGVLRAWWTQHAEHRLIVGNIFFWIDLKFFKGTGAFLIVTNFVFVASIAALLARLALKDTPSDPNRTMRAGLIAGLFGLCFSWIQQENLNWAFQASFFPSLLIPLLTFTMFEQAIRTQRARLFLLSIFLGALSAGTMANGLAVLPLLGIASLLLRQPRTWIALIWTTAIAVVGMYFIGYKTPALNGSISESVFQQPWMMVRYVLTYIGGAAGYAFGNRSQTLAEVSGAIGLLLFSFACWSHVKRPDRSGHGSAALLFLCFIVISAIAVSGGRVKFGLDQAMSSRYMTYSLAFWAALIVTFRPTFRQRKLGDAGALLFSAVFISALLPNQSDALKNADEKNLNKLMAALAFEIGVRDEQQISYLFPWVDVGFVLAERPRARNLSIFGDPRFADVREKMGKDAGGTDTLAECFANLEQPTSIPGEPHYRRISGTITAQTADVIPTTVSLIDQTGTLVGYGLVGEAAPNGLHPGTENSRSFKAYLSAGAGPRIMIRGNAPACVVTEHSPTRYFQLNE